MKREGEEERKRGGEEELLQEQDCSKVGGRGREGGAKSREGKWIRRKIT